ncbi:thioredoxin domain-containing protein [Microbacterium sp. 3J1]|uniref:DsbA family protein n=1 Tax=Microbacterium sp. 3J1 TaxID=861269 RepID=UPI000B15C74D|nr:thioredoxin domain-containing protein [Microbacterium sp. 3J1]
MAAAKSNTNWFVIGVSAAVVVVLAVLATVVVLLNNQATAPGVAPKSDIVNQETGAISFGSGEDEIDTYIDFMCPVCGQFEDAYGEQLQTAAANDEITLNIHPVSILNRASTTGEFSSLSGSSMYCVAQEAPDAALDYFNLLFANQPAENSAGLSIEQMTALAEQAGAGAAAECIADGTFMQFVDSQTKTHEIGGTPTVEVNGTRIENAEIGTEFAKILG